MTQPADKRFERGPDVTEAGDPSQPPTRQASDQTLALPDSVQEEAPATFNEVVPPHSVGERTENLTAPGNTQPPSMVDQTLNEASIPMTEAGSGSHFASMPTRRAGQVETDGHDTAPLSTDDGATLVPATRHGDEVPTTPMVVSRSGVRPRFPNVPGYELLSELGRGGMGIVYKARHIKLNRIVALKMIRSGAQAGSEDLRRFREEASAVARMQNTNIVQIYEVGEVEGLPFFSLEYVDGGSLQQRMSKETSIPARESAELLETLARAMDYAHQRGIVHRDLKPGNILLERTSNKATPSIPKITDFGLAKQIEKDSSTTREGSVLGTPSYMAPEQAQGRHKEVGPPADIYALGAILYDLLASRPPFRGETVMDTLQQVINVEPMPPRRLQPSIARDLETICLRCLEKEIRKRYATAGALADDLRRYLNGEPIEARATPWWEKGIKWAKRRPAAAGLLFFAVMTILALIGGSMWYASEKAEQSRVEKGLREKAENAESLAKQKAEDERIQREKADEATRLAERESQRANLRARDALMAVDRLLTRVSDLHLEHMPHLQPLRRTLLAEALDFLKRFHEDNRTDPVLGEQLAFAQRQMGSILEDLGDRAGAMQAFREALRLSDELVKANPEAVQHVRNTGIIADKLAIIQQAMAKNAGDLKQAEEGFGQAVVRLEKAHQQCLKTHEKHALHAMVVAAPLRPAGARWGAVGDIVFAETWAKFGDLTAYSLADAHINRGNLRLQAGRLPEARKDFDEAIKLLSALHRDDPVNPDYRWRLGSAQANLAVNLYSANPANIGEAVQHLNKSITFLDDLVKEHGYSARYRSDRAGVYRNRGLFRFISAPQGPEGDEARRQAEADVKASIQVFELLAAQFPLSPDHLEQLTDCHEKLALIQKSMNRPADALKSWNEAIKAQQELAKLRDAQADRKKLALYLDSRAGVLISLPMPRLEDAAKDWQESIAILDALVKEQPRSAELWALLLNRHYNRVATWKTVGRIAEAERDMDPWVEALEERRNQMGDNPTFATDLAATYHDWGQLLRERGRKEEGEAKIRRGVHYQQEAIKAKGDDPAMRRMLCLYLLSLEDVKEAAEEVRNWTAKIPGEKGRPQEAAWVLAQCYAKLKDKDKDEAENHARDLVALLRKAHEAGFKDKMFLDKKVFDPLRGREDFKEVATLLQQ